MFFFFIPSRWRINFSYLSPLPLPIHNYILLMSSLIIPPSTSTLKASSPTPISLHCYSTPIFTWLSRCYFFSRHMSKPFQTILSHFRDYVRVTPKLLFTYSFVILSDLVTPHIPILAYPFLKFLFLVRPFRFLMFNTQIRCWPHNSLLNFPFTLVLF